MLSESLAIILVILVMAVMVRRRGKRVLAGLALPLICVPLMQLVCYAFFGVPARTQSGILYSHIFTVAGLVITIALCTFFAKGIQSRSVRMTYLAFCFIFSGALTVAYLLRG